MKQASIKVLFVQPAVFTLMQLAEALATFKVQFDITVPVKASESKIACPTALFHLQKTVEFAILYPAPLTCKATFPSAIILQFRT